jgi:hypothetical protein
MRPVADGLHVWVIRKEFMAEKETIVTKMYDLVKYLIPVVNRFPRDYKFTLGDRITQLVLDLLEHYVEAYYATNRQTKINLLVQNNLKLERLRFLIRLAHDFRLFSNQRFGYINAAVDEVGRMSGGWIKQLQKSV